MFKTTDANGFHITFANGVTVSVQWNPGNYTDDRDGNRGERRKARTVEVAAWNANGDWIDAGDNDVAGWQTPEQVIEIMARMAAMPA